MFDDKYIQRKKRKILLDTVRANYEWNVVREGESTIGGRGSILGEDVRMII